MGDQVTNESTPEQPESTPAAPPPAKKSQRTLSPWSLLLGGAPAGGAAARPVGLAGGHPRLGPAHHRPRVRPLHRRQVVRHARREVLRRVPAGGAAAHVGRDRVRHRHHPAGRLLQDQRHDAGGARRGRRRRRAHRRRRRTGSSTARSRRASWTRLSPNCRDASTRPRPRTGPATSASCPSGAGCRACSRSTAPGCWLPTGPATRSTTGRRSGSATSRSPPVRS